MLGRVSEFHHSFHIVWPLETEAVDEEERLMDPRLQ